MRKIKLYFLKNKMALKFKYDKELISKVKTIREARWNPTFKVWMLPIEMDYLQMLKQTMEGLAEIEYEKELPHDLKELRVPKKMQVNPIRSNSLKAVHQVAIKKFNDYLLANRYSENSRRSYIDAIRVFFRFYHDRTPSSICNEDVAVFNRAYILANNFSRSYQNQIISAIKLFYKRIDSKLDLRGLERPMKEHKLPNVLSKEEVRKILSALTNLKHRSMLSMLYACGLRRSELLKLRVQDINYERGVLHILQAKGNKDRIVPIGEKMMRMLQQYCEYYRPQYWLFEGQKEGAPYSPKSLEKVLKKATTLAGISKAVSPHWLRHSYATHLLEDGISLRHIQELLGHSSSKTTEIYTHVTTKSIEKIRSPFDDI